MYKITENYIDKKAKNLWDDITTALSGKKIQIESIQKVNYNIINTSNNLIEYQADTRNNKIPEEISKDECIDFLKVLIKEVEFNTSTIKKQIKSSLYQKRSPMFAILLYTGIIEKY